MEINQLIEKAQDFFTKEEFDSFTKYLLDNSYDAVEKMLLASAKKENEGDPREDDTAILEVVESVLATVDELIESKNRTTIIEISIENSLTENNAHIWQLPFREPVFIRAVLLELLRQKHGETIIRTLIGYLKEAADEKTFEDVTDFPTLRVYWDEDNVFISNLENILSSLIETSNLGNVIDENLLLYDKDFIEQTDILSRFPLKRIKTILKKLTNPPYHQNGYLIAFSLMELLKKRISTNDFFSILNDSELNHFYKP